MQVIASCSLKPSPITSHENDFVGRRQLLSSACSRISQGDDVVSDRPVSSVKIGRDCKSNLHELAMKSVPSTTRRILLTNSVTSSSLTVTIREL
ncbi:unnamed protein product [Thlaspi arvense]|uniref:Uncharacterized protein n=1 Tax=Thlaspi arvense TaxID=13288 RepID=A0AAU9T7V6_THLAR|nr:unnamed protein product [Thlaspi arvense]